MAQAHSTQPQGTARGASEATSGRHAQGQTLHLALSNWGGAHRPRPLRLAAGPACLRLLSQSLSPSWLRPPFLSLLSPQPPRSPALLPQQLVLQDCLSSASAPIIACLQARTSQHLAPGGTTSGTQSFCQQPCLYPSAICFRGCLSALCSPILAVSSADWPLCNQSERTMDPSRCSLWKCARRGRGGWRRRRRRRR